MKGRHRTCLVDSTPYMCPGGNRKRLRAVTAAGFVWAFLAVLLLPQSALAAVTWGPWLPAQGATVNQMPIVVSTVRGVSARFQNDPTDPVVAPTSRTRDCAIDGVSYPAGRTVINTHSETVYGIVATAQLADGSHDATLGEWVGASPGPYTRYATSWSFTLEAPPVLSSPVPANGWVSSVTRPTIGLTTDENGPGTHQVRVQLLVDAVQVFDGVVTEGPWTWTPSTDLADNSVHNVVALVTDAAGNTSGLIWSFSVVAPPPMYVGGSCTRAGCHEYYPAPHPVNNCEACHSYGDYFTGDHDSTGDPTEVVGPPAPGGPCLDCHGQYRNHSPSAVASDCTSCHNTTWTSWVGPPVPQHGDTDTASMHVSTTTGCYDPGCHDSNLVDGHSGRPAGADFTYQCALCHGPSTGTLTTDTRSPAVVAAVAAGDTGCDACHSPLPDHYALHEPATVPAECSGSGCHAGTNLLPIHPDLSCATCHESPDPNVTGAIAADDKTCATCHPASSIGDPPHVSLHEPAIVPAECSGSGCHAGTNLLPIHPDLSCATCHESPDPNVTGAIAAHDKTCATCHPASSIGDPPHVSLHEPAIVPAECSGSGCHAGTNLLPIHPDLSCATCHESPDPNVTGAIAADDKTCATCHPASSIGDPPHVSLHEPAIVPAECQGSGCHSGTNLLPIHPDLSCATCHESPDPNVTGAIAAGDKTCATCHPASSIGDPPHVSLHEPAIVPPECQGSGCHAGTNLLPIHSALTCADCHESTDPNVTGAIAAGDKTCATCHPASSIGDPPHVSLHEPATVPAECQGSGCHSGTNLLPIHSALTCAPCHESPDPNVTGAIAAHDKTCATCHPASSIGDPPHVSLHEPATVPAECQGSGCHSGTNLLPIHSALSCATCHESTDPNVAGAIAAGDKTCATCHPAVSADHVASHDGQNSGSGLPRVSQVQHLRGAREQLRDVSRKR